MDIVGLDLHKRQSQLAIKTPDGTIRDHRIATTRDWFTALFGDRPSARILLEASTESEWVARHLEALGHEVIVADPNYAPMYAHRSRRTKTDRRDAHTLMTACETGTYRPAHRLADSRRHVRAELAVRDTLVRTRARYAALGKTLTRRDGFRVPSSDSRHVPDRILALPLSPELQAELAPLLALYTPLNEQIKMSEDRLAALARTEPIMRLLTTVPGVGPVTAASFVSTIDDVARFESAHHVEAYLGLVPSERSSGERRQLGSITKTGNTRTRWLLVEAAWCILRFTSIETDALRSWATAIAVRRGNRIATVALARRLAGILFAMWRDGTTYDAAKLRRRATMVAQQGERGSTLATPRPHRQEAATA